MPKKTLYIARHAKSSWDDASLSDFERPLNKRGKRDAPIMAEKLKALGVKPDLILSSPAKRAKTTAKHYRDVLGSELQYDERIYEASLMSLIYLAQEKFEDIDSLMIVGHNPGLTMFNDRVSNKSIFNIPTAGVVAIKFDGEVAARKGKQMFYEYPKKYVDK